MSLSKLPRELLLLIADNLRTPSLARLLRTCRSLQSILVQALTTRITTEHLASSILFAGIDRNHLPTVQLALSHKAAWHTSNGRFPNRCRSAILEACQSRQFDIVVALIAHYGPTILTDNDTADGYYCHDGPLEHAIRRSDLAFTTVLLEHGAPANLAVSDGYTRRGKLPIELAAKYGSAMIVEALLKHGARLEGARHALRYAVKAGNWDVARVLLRNGVSVSERDFGCCVGYAHHRRTLEEVEAFVIGGRRFMMKLWQEDMAKRVAPVPEDRELQDLFRRELETGIWM